MTSAKGIVVAGLAGGSGKSVVSVGLTAAWTQGGTVVAPFKKGPDYIDAGWLQLAAGRNCYNLDPYLMPESMIKASFSQRSQGAELALVEGNRGLFDGVTAQGRYSTAELALSLKLPVLLVVNCSKTTRTIAALVLGCMKFDERITICGVVLNQVATERQRRIITESVEHYCGVPVVGAVPRMATDIFPMRHLGMIPHQEYEGSSGALEQLARVARDTINTEEIKSFMADISSDDEYGVPNLLGKATERDVKIGVLQDAAFQFYYPENLAALERSGAELISINALEDTTLPAVDGLYIGGGFPETSARELSNNTSFRLAIKESADAGLPIYAECGGLIYLGESIVLEEREYPLAGVFPVRYGMSAKPQAHGYSIFTVDNPNPFYPVGTQVKGHEFRYSTILDWTGDMETLALEMNRGTGFRGGRDGLVYKNVLALYTHVHADGTPAWAEFFVQKCRQQIDRH